MRIHKNQSGSAVIILLVVLVLAVIGFGGYYVWHTQHKTAQTTNATTTPSVATNTTAPSSTTPATQGFQLPDGWQWYKNTTYGFEVAYPSTWGDVTQVRELSNWAMTANGTSTTAYQLNFATDPSYFIDLYTGAQVFNDTLSLVNTSKFEYLGSPTTVLSHSPSSFSWISYYGNDAGSQNNYGYTQTITIGNFGSIEVGHQIIGSTAASCSTTSLSTSASCNNQAEASVSEQVASSIQAL